MRTVTPYKGIVQNDKKLEEEKDRRTPKSILRRIAGKHSRRHHRRKSREKGLKDQLVLSRKRKKRQLDDKGVRRTMKAGLVVLITVPIRPHMGVGVVGHQGMDRNLRRDCEREERQQSRS